MLSTLILATSSLLVGYISLTSLFPKCRRWWILRNIQGPACPSWLTGHVLQFWEPLSLPFHRRVFDTYGRVMKIYGLFGDPQLYISDPRALASILAYDFDIFHGLDVSGELYLNEYLFGPGVNSKNAEAHRKQRKLLNPVFSPANIRRSMPIVYANVQALKSVIIKDIGTKEAELDIAEYFGRLSLESISQICFGYSFDAIHGDNHEYVRALKEVIPAITKVGAAIPLLSRLGLGKLPGHVLYRLGRLFPSSDLHYLMDVVDIMHGTARQIFSDKKKLVYQGDEVVRSSIDNSEDFMSILLKANLNASASEQLTDEEVTAQMSTLVLAGTDSTSLVICRILELLASDVEAQTRLRTELAAHPIEEIDHSKLMSLPYLDAVIKETLRLYAPGPFRPRRAAKDTFLPLQRPFRGIDGRSVNELFIPKGMEVVVNIYGLNTDVEIWGPNALEWNPDRWLSPLPQSVIEAGIPGSYSYHLAFLAGQRVCIGMKFAELLLKVSLAALVPAFRFAPSGEDIVWRYGAMISPNLKQSTMEPRSRLPLRLTPIL